MELQDVSYDKSGRIATITLNRPQRLNAISARMPREIKAAVERANRDDEVHVIVLTGQGRAFCSGMAITPALSFGRILGNKWT